MLSSEPDRDETVGGAATPLGTEASTGQGRRVFRNTLLNGLGVTFTLALALILVPFSIHRLGSDAYAVWVLALSFALTGGYLSLADLGLHQSIVKFVAEAESRHDSAAMNAVVSSAAALFLVVGIVVSGLAIALGFASGTLFNVPSHLQPALRLLFFVIAADAGFGLPGLAFQGLLEGHQRYGVIRLVDVSRQVVYAALVFGILTSGYGVVAFGSALAISTAFGALGYFVAARRVIPSFALSRHFVRRETLRQLLHFGGWVFISQLTGVVWRQMDKVILAVMLTSSVLTGYDVANKIQASSAVILSFTVSAVMPVAAGLSASRETERLRELLVRGTRYSVALSFPVILGATVMARPLIGHWVGTEFEGVASAAQMFLAYQFLAGIRSTAHTMLIGLGRVKQVTAYGVVSVVVNLAISIALAPTYGIKGVIAGTLVGYGLVTPLYLRLAVRELGMTVRDLLDHALWPMTPWALAFLAIAELTRRAFPPSNLVMTVLVVTPALAVYATGVALVAMDRSERRMLAGFVLPDPSEEGRS